MPNNCFPMVERLGEKGERNGGEMCKLIIFTLEKACYPEGRKQVARTC